MPRKTRYAVYRHGANRANQPGNTVLVAIVEAESREAATECETQETPTVYDSAWLKLAPDVDVWANQTLSAKPVSQISAREYDSFFEGNS